MALSKDLINQFVKLTTPEPRPSEVTVNATYKKINNEDYVQIDGSEIWTPVNSTVTAEDNDRVKVLIKNHQATITGNITSPSARSKDVNNLKDEVDENGNTIKQLNTTILQQDSSIQQIDTNIKQINTTILQHTTSINQQNTQIQQFDTTIRQQSDDITSMNNTILNQSNSIIQINNSINSVNNTIQQHDNVIKQQGDLITSQGNIITSQGNKISAFDSDISILNSAFVIQNGELRGLSSIVVDNLVTEHMSTKYANIDFANIGEAAIKKLFSDSGIIKDLVVNEGHITGELVGVTIKGDLIEGGTVVADKLVVKGENGLYYKLNTDGESTTSEQTEYNSLNGSVITAKSITADRISVTDLVAFGATIGGFNITQNSLYSGVKSSATNTTKGVYMDSDGQFAVGDNINFIKYYYDENSKSYKLDISADSIKLGTSGTLNDFINDFQKSIKNITIQYAISNNSSTPPTTGWGETMPSISGDNKYIWQKSVCTYNDDTSKESEPFCINASVGAEGKGIDSLSTEFYLSDSKDQITNGEWVGEMPTLLSGKYLWTRTKIVYKNPTSVEYTEPLCDSVYNIIDNSINNITDTSSGVFPLTLKNSAGKPVIEFEVEGNSYQEISTGRNKCSTDISDWEYGIYDDKGNKVAYNNRIRLKELLKVDPSTEYYFNTFSDNYEFIIRTYNSNKEFVANRANRNNTKTYTTTSDECYLGIIIWSRNDSIVNTFEQFTTLFNNKVIKPFICLNSEINKDYEKFGITNPDNVAPIYNVGNSINIVPTDIENWVQGTISNGNLKESETRISTKDFIRINENIKYTFSVQNHLILNVWYYDKNKDVITNMNSYTQTSSIKHATPKIPPNTKYVKMVVYKSGSYRITPNDIIDIKPKIEEGCAYSNWSSYNEKKIDIITTNANMYYLNEKSVWSNLGLNIIEEKNHCTINGTTTADGFIGNNVGIFYLTPGEYCFKFDYQGTISDKNIQVLLYGKSINIQKTFFDVNLQSNKNKELKFILTETTMIYGNFYVFNSMTIDVDIELSITKYDDKDKSIIDAEQSKENINLNDSFLGKVNNAKDRLYLDSNGQAHIEKKIDKVILDGTQSPDSINYIIRNTNTIRFDFVVLNNSKKINSNKIICDKFMVTYADEGDLDDIIETEHCRNSTTQYYNKFIIYINKSRLENISTDGNAKTSVLNWLKENPVTVYYELEKPYIVDLDYYSIDTFKNDGYIIIDSLVESNNGYIKYYIDNPFTENFLTTSDKQSILSITNQQISSSVTEINKTVSRTRY